MSPKRLTIWLCSIVVMTVAAGLAWASGSSQFETSDRIGAVISILVFLQIALLLAIFIGGDWSDFDE